MKVKIEIETKTFIRFWLVVVAFVALFAVVTSAVQALVVIGTAFFLALALNGPVNKLASIMPGRSRVAGTTIAYILVVAFLGAFTFLVVPPVIEQSAKVAGSIPALVDEVQEQERGISDLAVQYGLEEQLNQTYENIKKNATDWATNWAQNIGANIITSVGSLVGFFVATLLVIVLTFLMLIEAPRWQAMLWSVYNDKERMKHHRELATKMHTVVSGFVTGQLAVAAVAAFFAGFTVFLLSWLFTVPHNLALPAAAIVFILTLIPMFGSTIAGVLISVLIAFNDVGAAVIFAVYFIVYQQIENNFISPAIQSKTVELSALAVLVAVTIGVYLFGIAGGIISIPIAGSIKVLVEDYVERSKRRRKEASHPLQKLINKVHEEA